MRFEFATANRILFGAGTLSEAIPAIAGLGRRAFVIADSPERSAPLIDQLREAGAFPLPYFIHGEPSADSIRMAVESARRVECDVIVSIGGGSALDTGKAAAVLLTNPGDLLDYVEVVGKGLALKTASLPFVAIPTTAGTGSEVTRNAVISILDQRVKVSLRSPFMLPALAVVDPDLTCSLPPAQTAHTGMDALTQLIEPFVSPAANPLTDPISREGIRAVARSLLEAYQDGQDSQAREAMSLASLFGGLALANGKLGAVHGMANPIGGMCAAPHGAICARLLPLVMETNIRALRSRSPDSAALARYQEAAGLLTGSASVHAEDGTAWVAALCKELNIRPLGEYGLDPRDFPQLVAQSQKANSMKGNPISLTDEEVLSLLEKAG